MTELPAPQIVHVGLHQVTVFKCTNEERTIKAYTEQQQPKVTTDWSAIYFQLDRAHAIGTASYRWDRGCTHACIVKGTLHRVNAILVRAAWMSDPHIAGARKAEAVKKALGLEEDATPLVDCLAQNGYIMICPETEDQWEVLISHSLVNRVQFLQEEVVMELKPNKWGCTGTYQTGVGPDAAWRPYQESMALVKEPLPLWLTSIIATIAQ